MKAPKPRRSLNCYVPSDRYYAKGTAQKNGFVSLLNSVERRNHFGLRTRFEDDDVQFVELSKPTSRSPVFGTVMFFIFEKWVWGFA